MWITRCRTIASVEDRDPRFPLGNLYVREEPGFEARDEPFVQRRARMDRPLLGRHPKRPVMEASTVRFIRNAP